MHKNTAGQIFLTGGTNFGSLQRDRSAKLFELCFQSFCFFDGNAIFDYLRSSFDKFLRLSQPKSRNLTNGLDDLYLLRTEIRQFYIELGLLLRWFRILWYNLRYGCALVSSSSSFTVSPLIESRISEIISFSMYIASFLIMETQRKSKYKKPPVSSGKRLS